MVRTLPDQTVFGLCLTIMWCNLLNGDGNIVSLWFMFCEGHDFVAAAKHTVSYKPNLFLNMHFLH